MEEKKNNAAVEKAESAAKKSGTKKKTSTAKKKPTVKKSESQKARDKKKKEREVKREQLKQQREQKRAERERIMAEKRVELARIKAHKKAEKEKAKATALREKNRRKAEYKAEKQRIKAEKEARREMLKKETKKERQERLALEHAARMQERKEKRERKAEERKHKLALIKAKREQRSRERQKNKDRNKGFGGWLAAVISLGVATLVLASVLTFTFLMPTATDSMLEAAYQKSFYDTVAEVDNIDLNLSKAIATEDTGALQKYLVDTAINSELCENDLQQLPLQDESKYYTTKLINQIGDYAKYLNNKIISGEELTDSDFDTLSRLYKANLTFKDSLQKMLVGMGNDFSFSSLMEGGDGNLVISNFNELQNLSVQYPELIYDGPFSDGRNNREVKGLDGADIDEQKAVEIFKTTFAEYGLTNVKSVGVSAGNIECFNVQGEKDGDVLYAEISKKGGKLVMFAFAGECNDVKMEKKEATEAAEKFLESVEIKGMKPVWINLSNNVYTINFAFEEGNAIVYSDLVKVRVCAQTGKVIGIEATEYFTNHTERVVEKPVLTEAAAQEKVSANIEVDTARLAIVPIGKTKEKLCYEFSGEYDGATYYVYIDAISGRQIEMFKVIKSTEGELLM